jgi:hypothetical protein
MMNIPRVGKNERVSGVGEERNQKVGVGRIKRNYRKNK